MTSSPNTVDIRDAGPADRPQILESSRALGGPVLVVAGALVDLRQAGFRVAVMDGQCAGWCATRIVAQGHWDLTALFCFRRRAGVGHALVQDAIAKVPLGHRITVETTDDNLPAQNLYVKCGFTRVGTVAGGFATVLRLKGLDPTLSVTGWNGKPIRDILQFELEV